MCGVSSTKHNYKFLQNNKILSFFFSKQLLFSVISFSWWSAVSWVGYYTNLLLVPQSCTSFIIHKRTVNLPRAERPSTRPLPKSVLPSDSSRSNAHQVESAPWTDCCDSERWVYMTCCGTKITTGTRQSWRLSDHEWMNQLDFDEAKVASFLSRMNLRDKGGDIFYIFYCLNQQYINWFSPACL